MQNYERQPKTSLSATQLYTVLLGQRIIVLLLHAVHLRGSPSFHPLALALSLHLHFPIPQIKQYCSAHPGVQEHASGRCHVSVGAHHHRVLCHHIAHPATNGYRLYLNYACIWEAIRVSVQLQATRQSANTCDMKSWLACAVG